MIVTPIFGEGPLLADFVAKVENRTTQKISRKLIFGLFSGSVAFQRRYGGPWSFCVKRCGPFHIAAGATHQRP
jgi:hypothetical protein